jgi:hypothetical protein
MKYKINIGYDIKNLKELVFKSFNDEEQATYIKYKLDKKNSTGGYYYPLLGYYNIIKKYGIYNIDNNILTIDTKELGVNINKQQALNVLLGLDLQLNEKVIEKLSKEQKNLFEKDTFIRTYYSKKTRLQELYFTDNTLKTDEFLAWAVDSGFLKEAELPEFPAQNTKERLEVITEVMNEITFHNPKLTQNPSSKLGLEEIKKRYKVKKLSFETIKSKYYKNK